MKPPNRPNARAASANITKRIQALGDWRGDILAHVRQLIHEADPEIQEEWKWAKPASPGTPVWSHDGIVCTGESYKQVVKLTFARGASIKDPKKLFNASLEGNVRRAIDIREGEALNEAAFRQLVRSAVAANSEVRQLTGGQEEEQEEVAAVAACETLTKTSEPLDIPYSELSPRALLGVVEAFVLREGTDYGAREYSLEEKVQHVMGQLRSGEARIVFQPETETVTIVPANDQRAP